MRDGSPSVDAAQIRRLEADIVNRIVIDMAAKSAADKNPVAAGIINVVAGDLLIGSGHLNSGLISAGIIHVVDHAVLHDVVRAADPNAVAGAEGNAAVA